MSSEHQFINRLSHRLEKFSWVSNDKCIFRCPICGDSKKDPEKRRGAIFQHSGEWFFSCFNGCEARSFAKFLRQMDPELSKEYRVENLKSKSSSDFNIRKTKEKRDDLIHKSVQGMFETSAFSKLQRVRNLRAEHPARTYLRSRTVPGWIVSDAYYTDDFNRWASTVVTDRELSDAVMEGIVFPIRNRFSENVGCTCRFIGKDVRLRYKSLMFETGELKCYGLDRLDFSKDISVFEGIFDSVYAKNSVASLDASLQGFATKIMNRFSVPKERFVLWYDFEPANEKIWKMKEKAIEAGFRVAFLPKDLLVAKDLSAIVAKYEDNPIDIIKRIWREKLVLSGPRAKAEFLLNRTVL